MKLLNTITFLTVLLGLNLTYASPLVKNKPSFECYPNRIVDGDTLDASCDINYDNYFNERIRIRIASIDTFESRRNKRAYRQSAKYHLPMEEIIKKGKLAKEKLKELLPKRQKFTCILYGRGRYGRFICRIINYQTIDISKYLVCNGYATPFMVRPIHRYLFRNCLKKNH